MSYRKRIEEILSDGNWHCVLGIIAETGLSARNRISEMNQDYQEEMGYPIGSKEVDHLKYLGVKCTLEKCTHKAKLFMYILNRPYYKGSLVQLKNPHNLDEDALKIEEEIDDAGSEEMNKEWEEFNREEKKARIKKMLSDAIENEENKLKENK